MEPSLDRCIECQCYSFVRNIPLIQRAVRTIILCQFQAAISEVNPNDNCVVFPTDRLQQYAPPNSLSISQALLVEMSYCLTPVCYPTATYFSRSMANAHIDSLRPSEA